MGYVTRDAAHRDLRAGSAGMRLQPVRSLTRLVGISPDLHLNPFIQPHRHLSDYPPPGAIYLE
eukprot:2747608-Pyramimonas_sp.AAC.1